MPGFNSFKALVDADDAGGAHRVTSWRKTPSVTTAAGFWFDISLSPGNPNPQYYAAAPLVSTPMAQSTDGGIFHGGPVAPDRLFLRNLMALSVAAGAVPMTMILCDYLMFYPFVDEAETSEQLLTNSVPLPRYADGAGVQVMLVVVAAQIGGQTITMNYTNSLGIAGRTSKTVVTGTQSVTGTILTSAVATNNACAPFMPLQDGDTGVRSIEGFTTSGGDVGLFTAVMVKPLATMNIRGIDAPVEIDFLTDQAICPRILDDAYLNFVCLPAGSLAAAPIHGLAEFTWG